MYLNLAFTILIILLCCYVVLSVFTVLHYSIFKKVEIIEVFFKISFLAVVIVFLIFIFFSAFKNLNVEFYINF